MKWIILFCLLVSCATQSNNTQESEALAKEPMAFKVTDLEVQTGKVKFIEIDYPVSKGKVILSCGHGDKKLKYAIHSDGEKIKGFISANYFSSPISLSCYHKDTKLINLHITEYPYKKEFLNVDKKRVFLNDKDLARAIKEKPIKKAIYKKSADEFLFNSPFELPLNSFITSYYGNKRVFNKKKESQHLGNDFRAKVGTPIPVSNDGKVVFVGDLFFSGQLVAVDHGLNIFSVYAHLSKIKVNKGDFVKKGDILGLSGATGRVSGPHLHWGVKINGSWIDGFSLVEESKKINNVE